MPAKNQDLHGMAPDSSDTALLMLDVLNRFEFAEAAQLLRHALPMAERLARLKRRCSEQGIPAIYVNDNFGRWQSDFRPLLEQCLDPACAGHEIARMLLPAEEDYFVLKPKHSGFYGTTLDILLSYLGVERLIITGMAGNICVLFTANDAYMRDYLLHVPSDCSASNSARENEHALRQMKKVLHADITPSDRMVLRRQGERPRGGKKTPALAARSG